MIPARPCRLKKLSFRQHNNALKARILQPIESFKIKISDQHCLRIGFGLASIQSHSIGVVLGVRLGSFDYLQKNNDFENIVTRLACMINKKGIPTIAADACFNARYNQASSVSLFSFSICIEDEDTLKPKMSHMLNLPCRPLTSDFSLINEKAMSPAYFLEYFDKQIQGRMVLDAGLADASVLQLDETNLLAVSLKQLMLNELETTEQAINGLYKQAIQSVMAVGAQPLGVVCHLSSRQSEKYRAYLRALNVSMVANFIDETDDVLTFVGLGHLAGVSDLITYELKRAETTLMWVDMPYHLLPKPFILSAHVVRDEGLMTAIAEMCFKNMLGVNITIPTDVTLSAGSLILEVANDKLKDMRQLFADHQLTFFQLGRTTKMPLIQINKEIQLSLQAIKERWQQGLQERVV